MRAEPTVGIGQQAMLVSGHDGGVLWDPPGLITDEAVELVRSAGSVLAVAASHPHMFGVQLEWAAALDAPVLVSEADVGWVQRSGEAIRTWHGTYPLADDLTLLTLGGHFPGSAVLLWTGGAGGKGVLLTGDTIFTNPDGTASFMRSYPNRIPLSGAVVQRIADATDQLEFDRIYNNFGGMIAAEARQVIRFSADRHAAWVRGDYDHLT
jgi:glyoxylase-like metal-dependent hydrolase (beta-lactamase superfamily II)